MVQVSEQVAYQRKHDGEIICTPCCNNKAPPFGESGYGIEPMTDSGGCLNQIGSELIELLSSALQGNPQGNTPACCADCHIKVKSKLYASILHPGVFAPIISIVKVVLR